MFNDEEILKELAREISLRRAVYPQQVRTGKLTAKEAERRINILLQLCREYGGHGDAGATDAD